MGTRHHAPDMFTRVMQFVWDMFETALNLGDDADRYRLFDTVHTLAAVGAVKSYAQIRLQALAE